MNQIVPERTERNAGATFSMSHRSETARLLKLVLFIVFVVVLVRNAWISQRAYVNFRVIENVVHGYGLGVNPGERVLPVSQPLWPLLLAGIYALTETVLNLPINDHLYSVTLSVNILLSLLVILTLFRVQRKSDFGLVLGFVPLILSKAFVDYSTSGLETSFVHLLLVGLFFLYLKIKSGMPETSETISVYLLGALILMVQWELVLMIAPVLISLALYQRRDPRSRWMWLLTVIFAISYGVVTAYYYGSLFPNMYVARFHAGAGFARLARQGLMYLLHSVDFDPVSILVILSSLLGVFLTRKKELYPFALGIMGTLLMILIIGGDSMGGRMLAPVVLVSALLLAHLDLGSNPTAAMGILMLVAVGTLAGRSPIMSSYSYDYSNADHRGILDARGLDYPKTGLLRTNRNAPVPPGSSWSGDDWVFNGYREVMVAEQRDLGFKAYAAGPSVYLLADTGMTDPLLARLPTEDKVVWDIDAMDRAIPDGYEQAVLHDSGVLTCEPLGSYYQGLRQIVRGNPGFSTRINAVFDLALSRGVFKHLPACD